MSAASDTMIIDATQGHHMAELRSTIKRVKTENAKVNTEYESLKAEVVKAVQGKSKMPMDVLSELVEEKRDQVIATSERLTELNVELEQGNAKLSAMQKDLKRIHTWSEIFDDSDMSVKKMITSYIIKRVNVYAGYKLDIGLNMNVQQFVDGRLH